MNRITCLILIALSGLGLQAASAAEGDVVFRSDVALARVDAQVVDRDNRAITGLRAEDFILRENGQPREIRNFASEDMPVDVVLLLDVSGSMRPHVERIYAAAHNALQVLGDNDRVAIMVFDRTTRLRLPFRNSREDVERGLELLLRQETFDGGTDITRGLLDAAQYVGREGRRDARRAVVILTDDQTGGQRDEAAVSRALVRADSVLSALIAPDAMQGRYGQQGGGYPRRRGSGYPGGSSWPGGGGIGGTLGGIILGRGGPYGGSGGGMPGPVVIGGGPRMQSAGTSEIARQSGGDSMPVDDASALETTLSRIRQRYALHYYLPEGDKPVVAVQVVVIMGIRDPQRRSPDRQRQKEPDDNTRSQSHVRPEALGQIFDHPGEHACQNDEAQRPRQLVGFHH
ncbi:MAG TPA: VWA domain-containing protein [Bryobacteraceae bacterium]|nr:VWA domain-containing protein [Bryobacteraceae bacterium]